MQRCETCRFWGWTEYREEDGYKQCSAILDHDHTRGSDREIPAYTASYDGSGLLTLPTFGCVLHDPKGGES